MVRMLSAPPRARALDWLGSAVDCGCGGGRVVAATIARCGSFPGVPGVRFARRRGKAQSPRLKDLRYASDITCDEECRICRRPRTM